MVTWQHGTLIAQTVHAGGGSIEFVTAEDSETVSAESSSGRRQMNGLDVLAEDGWEVVSGPAFVQTPNSVVTHTCFGGRSSRPTTGCRTRDTSRTAAMPSRGEILRAEPPANPDGIVGGARRQSVGGEVEVTDPRATDPAFRDATVQVKMGNHSVAATEVLSSYWHLAAERQRVYFARLAGKPAPWTSDPVITRYRFTNAYRAADRVSQDLIRIAYKGPQAPGDLTLRVLLYRFFNKPSTWQVLEDAVGEVTLETFNVETFADVLDKLLVRGERVYSAAYIVPPPPFGALRKHRNHLLLVEHMLATGLPERLSAAPSMKSVYETLSSYPSLGPFLAYQLAIDFNYTTLIDFDENDFVVPGPGALSGIAKCFPGLGAIPASDVIRWMVDSQNEQCDKYGVVLDDLFGRPLTLIDCQNLFCETDKYARVMHPAVAGLGKRTRIKQQYLPNGPLPTPFFPPKWGINDRCRSMTSSAPSSMPI